MIQSPIASPMENAATPMVPGLTPRKLGSMVTLETDSGSGA